MSNDFFRLGIISILLATSFSHADSNNCPKGACFAKLDNNKPLKSFKKTKEVKEEITFVKQPRYLDENIALSITEKAITIVLDGEMTIVFPHETYVMNEAEKMNYLENERAKESLLLLAKSQKKIEDKILEKSDLPSSEYFCKNKKKVIVNASEHTFQCV